MASVSVEDRGLLVVAANASSLLPQMLMEVGSAGASVSSVEVQEPDLESVFLHLTGKALRDAA